MTAGGLPMVLRGARGSPGGLCIGIKRGYHFFRWTLGFAIEVSGWFFL